MTCMTELNVEHIKKKEKKEKKVWTCRTRLPQVMKAEKHKMIITYRDTQLTCNQKHNLHHIFCIHYSAIITGLISVGCRWDYAYAVTLHCSKLPTYAHILSFTAEEKSGERPYSHADIAYVSDRRETDMKMLDFLLWHIWALLLFIFFNPGDETDGPTW